MALLLSATTLSYVKCLLMFGLTSILVLTPRQNACSLSAYRQTALLSLLQSGVLSISQHDSKSAKGAGKLTGVTMTPLQSVSRGAPYGHWSGSSFAGDRELVTLVLASTIRVLVGEILLLAFSVAISVL